MAPALLTGWLLPFPGCLGPAVHPIRAGIWHSHNSCATSPSKRCLHGEAQHRNRIKHHPHRSCGPAAPSLQFLDVLSGLNLQPESPLSNVAFYKNDKKKPEWWIPSFRSWEASSNRSPSLGSSSIKAPTAQCKCLGRPKFQRTMSCSCIFSTCCMSKGKGNPAKPCWAALSNVTEHFPLFSVQSSALGILTGAEPKRLFLFIPPLSRKKLYAGKQISCLRLPGKHWDGKTSYLRLPSSPFATHRRREDPRKNS